MTTSEFPGYVASTHVAKIPAFGFLTRCYDSLFVERGDKNSRDNIVSLSFSLPFSLYLNAALLNLKIAKSNMRSRSENQN